MTFLLGVIADDYTGANDTGAQFKEFGMETVVITDVANIDNIKQRSQVLVVDTESRNDPQSLAYEKVRKVARSFKMMDIKAIYKKMDSTLRGNIGSELDAIMDELKLDLSIVAPAYPKNHRITVKGHHFIAEVPLEKTEFARQPHPSIQSSHIPTVIQSQSQRDIGQVNLSTVREGVKSLKHAIWSQKESGKEILVIDAVNQMDLRIIAKAVVDDNILACGSAGLAEELASAQSRTKMKPVIVISGSMSQATASQILRAKKVMDVTIVDLDVQAILEDKATEEEEINRIVEKVKDALNQEKDVVVRSVRSKSHVTQTQSSRRELRTDDEVRKLVLPFLGDVINEISKSCDFAGLVLIGGDTAIEVIKSMKVLGVRMKEEVLPGIPASEIIGGKHDSLQIVTKAGGFGIKDALIIVIDYLKRHQ